MNRREVVLVGAMRSGYNHARRQILMLAFGKGNAAKEVRRGLKVLGCSKSVEELGHCQVWG